MWEFPPVVPHEGLDVPIYIGERHNWWHIIICYKITMNLPRSVTWHNCRHRLCDIWQKAWTLPWILWTRWWPRPQVLGSGRGLIVASMHTWCQYS
jgi:hypothetical protein